MDTPTSSQMHHEEGARMSPKLSSRRKRSRPVKFYQDFILTDSIDDEAFNSSDPSRDRYEPSPVDDGFEGAPSSDQLLGEDSQGMIARQVTSIRDSNYLRESSSKRPRIEESVEHSNEQQEPQTTFSSLLHTFASHVNSRVDPVGQRSPFSERPSVSGGIWPLPSSSQSVLPPRQHVIQPDTYRQSTPTRDSPATTSSQDMSFSGMLQNFVSCVNDSPTKEPTVNQSSLVSLLNKEKRCKARASPSNSVPLSVGRQIAGKEEEQSYAGLLHSFASVVDKGARGSPKEKRLSPLTHQEPPRKATKSLLDVLHDTISRRVLESANSPQEAGQMGTSPTPRSTNYQQSTQLDKVMHCRDMLYQTQADTTQKSTFEEDSLNAANVNLHEGVFSPAFTHHDRHVKSEPEDELHLHSHQWSHIRNVLPPLDDLDEQADPGTRRYLEETAEGRVEGESSLHAIKQEPLDEDERIYNEGENENLDGGDAYSPATGVEPDDGCEHDQYYNRKIKEESVEEQQGKDLEGHSVNSTLREKLLSRMESRQSHQASGMSGIPSDEIHHSHSRGKERSPALSSNEARDQEQPAQTGLVSHLLSTGDSAHWKNKDGRSFADLLHNITSSMLDKDVTKEVQRESPVSHPVIKQEPQDSDDDAQPLSVQGGALRDRRSSLSLTALLDRGKSSYDKDSTEKKKLPRCVTRLLSEPSQATPRDLDCSGVTGKRSQMTKGVSYMEPPSSSSSPSVSSDDFDQNTTTTSRRNTNKTLHSLSPRSKHSATLRHRWRRIAPKIKLGWPKRKDDQKREMNVHLAGLDKSEGERFGDSFTGASNTETNVAETDNMSFTDILQKLAQKCVAGVQDPAHQGSDIGEGSRQLPSTYSSPQQEKQRYLAAKQKSEVLAGVPTAASLRNLLMQQGSLTKLQRDVESPSGSPASAMPSQEVSFSNLMQNMASTVTKKKGTSSHSSYEDLTTLNPPAQWTKTVSGNWLRFLLISRDENPRVTVSVSVNLWNTINELKIHCHHQEVPANHWIFRRFGKRLHLKAALQGVLEAISNGCSVCEGTTRGDLVLMYRNKLASTSRWQAAAVLEDSFGPATIRSSQCELLVSGLRRSREKRCSKCSKFVDRKLKAVMYHMKKKLGLS